MTARGSSARNDPGLFRRYALNPAALVTEVSGPGRVAAYLRNPRGTLFQIGAEEQALLRGLADGDDPGVVAVDAKAQFGINITAATVIDFAEQMVDNGILVPSDTIGADVPADHDDDPIDLTPDEVSFGPDEDFDADLDMDDALSLFRDGSADETGHDDGPSPAIENPQPRPSGRGPGMADPRIARRDLQYSDTHVETDRPRDMDLVLFDPSGLLRILGKVFWLPGVILGSSVMIPLGIVALLSIFHRLDEVRSTVLSVAGTFNLLGLLAVSLVTVNLIVRLVTGIVIQRRGGEVRRFGLIFMLFLIPRFSIDMNGVFRMDREDRVAVFAYALRTRLVIFALCTLMWAMTRQSGTMLPELMAMIGQIALFSFVISAFPLFSGEGYQLLCAYFNQPMLRERSFAYILGRQAKGQPPPGKGEAWTFVLYAVGTVLTSGLLIALLSAYVATALETRLGGTGVLIFLTLLVMTLAWFVVIRRRGRRIRAAFINDIVAERRRDRAGGKSDGGAVARQSGRMDRQRPHDATAMPANIGGDPTDGVRGSTALATVPSWMVDLPAPATPTARNLPVSARPGQVIDIPPRIRGVYGDNDRRTGRVKWLRRGIAAALITAAVICAFLPYNYETGGDFVILANDRVQVVAWVSSELSEVMVDEGDIVAAGTPLARQVDSRERYKLEVSQANLAKARAQLQNLEEGATPEEIHVAEQQVTSQNTRLPYLKSEADRAMELRERGVMPRSEAERIIGNYETGKADLRSAEVNLDRVRAKAQASEIAVLEADIDRLAADVAFNEANVESTLIVAPVAGRIVFDGDRRPVPGKFYETGALVMEIVGESVARAEIKVPEADVGLVREGERVRLKFWALPGEEQVGTVDSLAPVAEEEEFGRIVRIKTSLPNPDGLFRPGVTGYAKIAGEEMRVWEAYSRIFVRFFLIELWGWLP